MPPELDILAIADDLVARARAAGADAADAVTVAGTALGVSRRMRKPQLLERSESTNLGLRVLVGKRQAIASTSDVSPDSLDEVVARALAMARSVPSTVRDSGSSPQSVMKTRPSATAGPE